MGRRSFRFRLTVWYAVLLSTALALFGGLIWLTLRHRLIAEVNRDLEGRASRFEKFFKSEATGAAGSQLRDELDEFCQAFPAGSFVELSASGGGVTFRYPAAAASQSNIQIYRRQFAFRGEIFDLEMGAPVDTVLHTLALLRLLLWSLIPVVIAIACLGGAWLSGRAMKPVQDITAAARVISIENLSGRLPVPTTGEELARLTEILNIMLARLEAAVKTLSQFVADASHELRTPLAVIRTTAELALRRDRPPDSYRESLQEIAGESHRMTQLIEDLLLLARTDTAMAEMPLASLDIREVLRDVCAEIRSLAELRQISVEASLGEEAAVISGNRAALHRLFLVLLDNAVKYSRAGSEVVAAMETRDSRVIVAIEDFGAGIPEADLPHIFKRFYRADRVRGGGGHGLGLSLAESIARAHGAAIEVTSTEGAGSVFRLVFALRERITTNENESFPDSGGGGVWRSARLQSH